MGLVPGSGIGLQERCAHSSELRPVSLAMRCVRSIIEYLLRRRRRFPGPLLSGLLWWLDKPGNRDTGRGKRTGKDIGRGFTQYYLQARSNCILRIENLDKEK